MADDFALANRVFKSLLEHYWQARDAGTPRGVDQYPKGFTISYKKLIDASGVPLNPRDAGGPLYEVAEYCQRKDWPPLHSLVVRGQEGDPGDGYFRAPGTLISELLPEQRYAKWKEYVQECIHTDKFPREAPSID